MKKLKKYGSIVVALFLLLSFSKSSDVDVLVDTPQGNNWMKFIGDTRPLHFISMPGTHDSGALHNREVGGIVIGYAQCQDKSIAEQLEMGVRYLDIRCQFKSNTFDIYHGSVSQKQSFESVIRTCRDFLYRNPTETIIMSIKEENGSSKGNLFSNRFVEYTYDYPNLFKLQRNIPNIGEVRGKIVLVRRFQSIDKIGIDATSLWSDNTVSDKSNTDNVQFYIQDIYKFKSNNDKFNALKNTIEISKKEMMASKENRKLYLNFSSGRLENSSGSVIKAASNNLNPRLFSLLQENSNHNNYMGIIISDFINADIAQAVYNTNF